MPIIRRYIRLSPRDTILARIFFNHDDISYFTTLIRQSEADHTDLDNERESILSAPSRLHSIFRAIQPIVHRRLREQKREKGVSVFRVVGDRGTRDRQTILESDTEATAASSNLPGVVIREGAVGNGTGDVVINRGEGWECSLFLIKDRSKQSTVLIKDMQLIPSRSRSSKKRKREVIDVDADGAPATTMGLQDEQFEDVVEEDEKPEMRTSYTGFQIYGKTLYLVLRRVRRVINDNVVKDTSLWGDVTDSEDGNNVHDSHEVHSGSVGSVKDSDAGGVADGGIVSWISASQSIQPSEGADFEAR
ncbi:uncharacterized protein V1513DRAFT_445329 [Lipomyces chichibuensis]|uniref:uncharacterized protein n=1 Tax=Lipomyces chichibuensis TaxID=1546026 RepID=UPI0033435774